MIIDLLKDGNIQLKAQAKTWQEAGQIAGKMLVESGGVTPPYVDATISSVEKYGPYIVLVEGVALFHARPEDGGVNEICMSLTTLEKPVVFGADEKDPVGLVLAFGAIDHKSHIKALSELMKLLGNSQMISKICESDNVEDVLLLLNKLLEE